jgi:hypothetical protein
MEIAMHSMYQALTELDVLDGYDLLPLSQMRSANKKHGNVGDIELSVNGQIAMAWDAKYGKNYLRDEIEELADKLEKHTEVEIAGFITSETPSRLEELSERISEIETEFGLELVIESFERWVERNYTLAENHGVSRANLSSAWLTAYTESLSQKRRHIAPIDEPSQLWLSDLLKIYKAI